MAKPLDLDAVKGLDAPLQLLLALGALGVARFLLGAIYAVYKYFLRPGKNLRKLGGWAVVTGATGEKLFPRIGQESVHGWGGCMDGSVGPVRSAISGLGATARNEPLADTPVLYPYLLATTYTYMNQTASVRRTPSSWRGRG